MSRRAMKRTPLRRVSKKRAKQLRLYSKLRKAYLSRGICEFIGCGKYMREIHHAKGRIGDQLNNVNNFVGLCSEHHRWIHDHPNKAREMGLLA